MGHLGIMGHLVFSNPKILDQKSENLHIFGFACEFQKLKLWSNWTLPIPKQAPHFLKTGKFLGIKSQNIQVYIPKTVHSNPKNVAKSTPLSPWSPYKCHTNPKKNEDTKAKFWSIKS